jgi:hypothetical protein
MCNVLWRRRLEQNSDFFWSGISSNQLGWGELLSIMMLGWQVLKHNWCQLVKHLPDMQRWDILDCPAAWNSSTCALCGAGIYLTGHWYNISQSIIFLLFSINIKISQVLNVLIVNLYCHVTHLFAFF